MQKPTSLILLSSGLDSCLALVEAMKSTRVAFALTFDYGQVARRKEISSALKISKHYGIPHKVIKLPFKNFLTAGVQNFEPLQKHPLLNPNKSCPKIHAGKLDDWSSAQKSAKTVWIPNRNGVFLNIAAALAEAEKIDRIYVGFNQEEAKTFPDNSMAFVKNINKCFEYSTLNSVQVIAPTGHLNKTQILKRLMQNGFPINLIWSCYRGGRKMCGTCESCVRLKRAAKALHVSEKEFNF